MKNLLRKVFFMSLLDKYNGFFLKIIGIAILLSIYAGQISGLYAGDNEGLRELKRIGIEEFHIHSSLKNHKFQSIDSGTGIKVADIFYKELASYQHYDLIAPAEIPFRIELVKAPGGTTELPAIVDQINKPETGLIEEKSQNLIEIPDTNLIDLDSIVTRIVRRYHESDFDAVVTGVITKYDGKDGSAIAVNKPASIAFIAYLISLKDKKIIWRGHFAETQVALLDNLLLADRFGQAGGKWLSSDDLTQLVMKRVIKTFPGVNENEVKLIPE